MCTFRCECVLVSEDTVVCYRQQRIVCQCVWSLLGRFMNAYVKDCQHIFARVYECAKD